MKCLKTNCVRIVPLLVVMMAVIPVTGCSSGTVSGAVAGGTVAGIIQALNAESARLQQDLDQATAKWQEYRDQTGDAVASTEMELLEKKMIDLRDQINNLNLIQAGIRAGLEGASTDWNDPVAVGNYTQTITLAIIAYLLRKRREEMERK